MPGERPGIVAAAAGDWAVNRVAATGEGAPDDKPSPAEPTSIAVSGATPAPVDTPEPAGGRVPVVALDPGHGGPEVGAAAGNLAEKEVNLKIALKLADLLRALGYRVVLTRDSDRAVSGEYSGGGGYPSVSRDLQARIDIANEARADLFLSIHNNGSGDPGQSGTEVWYNKQRAFADRNLAFARLVQTHLVKSIRALGYPVFDRGIKDDSNFRIFQGRAYNLYVLGPGEGPRAHVPTRMPAALGESLFLSNPSDVAMLRQERTIDAIAAGYRDAISAYFERYPVEP